MAARDVIAIGASAGGIETLHRLIGGLPDNFPAAVFITQHLPAGGPDVLPRLLNSAGGLPVAGATDGEPIQQGRVYVAPPDFHLLLEPGRIHLSHGPRENLQRPCINAMFRSAAASYGPRVTGVLLSGLLDDGVAGLWEIQQKSGATVVQDPAEAKYTSLPKNAIRGLAVQYIVRIGEMASLLARLAMNDQNSHPTADPSQPIIEPTTQSCPECGGVMTTARMGRLREYRCHTGHRLGLETMIFEKMREVERCLDIALSQSEELTALLDIARADDGPEKVAEIQRDLARRKHEQQILRGLLGYPPKTK